MSIKEKIKEFEERTNNIWLVNDMSEDLVKDRTDYEELRERFIECVYFIENLQHTNN